MPPATPAKGDPSFNNWLHGVFNDPNKPATSATDAQPKRSVNYVALSPAPAPAPVNTAALPPAPPYPDVPITYMPPPMDVAAQPAQEMPAAAPPAPMEPVHLHPPVMASDTPPPAPQPMPEPMMVPASPVVTADATATQTPPGMEPVHLHAPGSLAPKSLTSEAPASEMASSASDEAVNLVPPATAAQTHYLPESRYAARRAQSDYNNND